MKGTLLVLPFPHAFIIRPLSLLYFPHCLWRGRPVDCFFTAQPQRSFAEVVLTAHCDDGILLSAPPSRFCRVPLKTNYSFSAWLSYLTVLTDCYISGLLFRLEYFFCCVEPLVMQIRPLLNGPSNRPNVVANVSANPQFFIFYC